ncbi:MAG TPA: glycosyltransferase family 1 protein, partial [Thermoanaerobaculia bacterium]|nr:glycosyltransferase family 1 protein [Thermoanaerobaculia bacterium]
MSRPRLLVVVTHPMTARILMRGQLRFLREAGFEVCVAAAGGAELGIVAEREGVAVAAVPFARQIRPLADLRALWVLAALVRRFRPAVVSAGT